ncbi:TadE/TadG family type IV pilus assembly protein [Streptomyces phaeochromogenes]|uniref:TadE/TadG family type IV pilus assembly protein n=1 Tax=Streptomyces phaeochromogenes TaxID=1923 RepID=UPI0038702801|nr:pilus assembly protein [Streptomyces phaeochromogenes]
MVLTTDRQSRGHPLTRPCVDVRLLRRLYREDRGTVTVEMVYIIPALFTLVMLLAQATLWWHAAHIAQATTAHALAATRVEHGTAADGQNQAQRVLDQLGRGPLRGVHVNVTRGAERADVRITGTASSVIPFLHLPVRAHAAGPVERFRAVAEVAP